MLQFQSLWFFVFLLVSLLVYYALPKRQWLVLLAASVVFYCTYLPAGLLWIAGAVLLSYIGAFLLARYRHMRGFLLTVLILALLSPLLFFKYFFTVSSLPLLVVPLGLSYYSFALMGYVIDVSRKKLRPIRHLGHFFVFATFFGTIMAGPIERAGAFVTQLKKRKIYSHDRFVRAFGFFLWGLFLKVVIADRAALGVNRVFSSVMQYHGLPLLFTAFLTFIQLFADFAGYSFMAFGVALAFGLQVTLNFKQPLLASSISEFWRHWHISLSNWLRDYLYIPLGGNRVSKARLYLNYLLVFVICGMWHGAAWTFVLWGALHGIYLALSVMLKPLRRWFTEASRLLAFPRVHVVLSVCWTFLLVTIGWVFFRSASIADALHYLSASLDFSTLSLTAVDVGIGWFDLCIVLLGSTLIFLVQYLERVKAMPIVDYVASLSSRTGWTLAVALCSAIVLLGLNGSQAFLYFKF